MISAKGWAPQLYTFDHSGFGEEHDDVQIYGEVSKGKFCAFYLKFGTVVAAAAMQKGNIVAFIAEKLYAGDIISKKEVDNLVVAFNLWNVTYSRVASVGPTHPIIYFGI